MPVVPQRDEPELVRRILDNAPAMLAYWGSDLRCRFANRAYERWFGARPATLLGKHLREVVGPSLHEQNLHHIEGVLRGDPQEFERELRNPLGGPSRYTLVNYAPDIVDRRVRGFLVMVTDISEIKRAKQALEESEARFSGIVSTSPDAIISIDADQRIVLFNQGAEGTFGWMRSEAIGQPFDILIPERFRGQYQEYVRQFLSGEIRRPRVGEDSPSLLAMRKSGEEFPVDVSVSKLGVADRMILTAMLRDISERKRRDDERRVFIALLDNAPDFIGIADPQGVPVYVNPAGRQMVGLPLDFPVEVTAIPDYYAPGERAFATEVILRSMTERGRWSGETYFRNWRTEEAIPVSDEHFMVRAPSGRVLGMATITRDISEARKLVREREELLTRERQAREQAEAANVKLRESEERFRLAFEEAPIGMALVALDGRFVRVNHVLCEILGYTADELMGLSFQAITHPDDVDANVAVAGQLTRREVSRYQRGKRYVRKDGSVVDVMLSVSIARDRDGSPLHYISQVEDITERKRLENALRLAEAKSSGILAISADAIISIDENQRITMFNEGAEKTFGYPRAEAIGVPVEQLIPERFRAAHREHVDAFASGPQAARLMGARKGEIFGLRKNGEEFPANAAISKLAIDGSSVVTVALRDVTEQKRVENEQRFLAQIGPVLASSLSYEETLAKVAELAVRDLADICLVEVVDESGEIGWVRVASRDHSKVWLTSILGRSRRNGSRTRLFPAVLERKCPVLMRRPTAQAVISLAGNERQGQALVAAGVQSVVVVPLVAGERLLGAIAFMSSAASGGYGPADLRLAEEVAHRAALAVENALLYRAARRATRARDDVLAIVAHDLRNPLNTIVMAAGALGPPHGEAERRSERPAVFIERAAMRMNRLIEDILDVSSIDAGQLSMELGEVAPGEIIAEAIESQQPIAAAASLELRQDVSVRLPLAEANHDRLLQVFENLIGNAIKFTKPSGQITVGAAPRDGEVLFWVSDTGSGIAEHDLPHVFDRFWQGGKRKQGPGSGLGLPIVKGIIDAHKGRVWVRSSPGHGSTFFFTIPTAPASETPKTRVGAPDVSQA